MPYFVNKTLIIAYFKNNVVHSHIFAGKSNPVRSEQAPFAKIRPNWGDFSRAECISLYHFTGIPVIPAGIKCLEGPVLQPDTRDLTFTPLTLFLILNQSRLSISRNENPPMKRKTAITSPAPDLPEGYPEFIVSLKQRIRSAQVKAALSVNRELVLLSRQIGSDILTRQKREGWGSKVIDRLSSDLIHEFPEMKGFSVRNLKYMRKFAEVWCDLQFVQQVAAQIP